MRKFLFLLSVVFVLSGCYQNHKLKDQKPPDLIPENKMANIIGDMNLVTTLASYRRARAQMKPTEQEYFQSVFKHYGVHAEQVRKSLDYYYLDKKSMVRIYDKVLSDFSNLQTELELEMLMKERQFIDKQGVLNYTYDNHWIYRDSVPAFDFKPVF